MTTSSTNPSSPPSAQCEVLFKLFEGPTGWLKLGRLLKGHEAGRLVLLRETAEAHGASLSAAVDSARCIAHPNVSKLLGVVWVDGKPHLASEYVDGVSLYELLRTFAKQPAPLEPRVAARIICDALSAVSQAKELLRDAGSSEVSRCLFSDTIWIAEFGETLLMEPGVAMLLNPETATLPNGLEPPSSQRASSDVRAAGLRLLELLTQHEHDADSFTRLESAPPALAAIVKRALSDDPALRFADPATMARSLAGLPPELIANEEEVGSAIQESMRSVLKGRRQKLSLLERLSAVVSDSEEDESTKFFGATGVTEASQRGTLPPPAASPNSETITARPPAPGAIPRVDIPRLDSIDDEAATRIYRPPTAPEPERKLEVAPERTVEVADPDDAPRPSRADETTQRALRAVSRPPAPPAKRKGSTLLIAVMSLVVVLSGLSAAEYFGWLRVPGARNPASAQASKVPWPLNLLGL